MKKKTKPTVFVVRCRDYREMDTCLTKLLDQMGGLDRFVAPDKTIVLKANLLQAAAPEKAVTTHPSLVASLGRLVQSIGARGLITDSPGAGLPYRPKTMDRVYKKTGMAAAARLSGIGLNRDFSYQFVHHSPGKLTKRFEIITPVLEAQGIINLCKLKTHSFMNMTGAVKNCFGVIPGYTKPGYHAKLRESRFFADMLLDLYGYLSPRLSIMDAVVGMMGDGPHAGDPVQLGYLIASTDALALDVVAARIMGLPLKYNPVILAAEERDLEPTSIQDIDLHGAEPDSLQHRGFKLPSTLQASRGLDTIPSPLRKLVHIMIKNAGSLKPVILKDHCTGCGTCRDACPQRVIELIHKKARISYRDCIRCYCCHEMCPENAITLRAHWLYRLVN